jgi:hypothetical protein
MRILAAFLATCTPLAAMANPISNYLVKQKNPAGNIFAVVDIANAELQLRRSGVNVFHARLDGRGVVLERRVEILLNEKCEKNCRVLEIKDPALQIDEVLELLRFPCLTEVFKERNATNTQPKGAAQAFRVSKTLVSCSENRLTVIDSHHLKLEVS